MYSSLGRHFSYFSLESVTRRSLGTPCNKAQPRDAMQGVSRCVTGMGEDSYTGNSGQYMAPMFYISADEILR
jgi:hypothetical protein